MLARVSRGLTWSITVLMKIDPGRACAVRARHGPTRREVSARTSICEFALSSASRAGMVNNLKLLRLGTALGLPELLAVVSDVTHPVCRGRAVGVPAVAGRRVVVRTYEKLSAVPEAGTPCAPRSPAARR